MANYTLNQLASLSNGSVTGANNSFSLLAYDSRKIAFPASTIFIALTTERRNGHHFLADAYQQGVRSFLVSEMPDANQFEGSGFVVVENTLDALQQLAATHRKQFNYPVVAITGSNGKTIVKEWLYEMLENEWQVVRSPKSFNSQLGVPLSVWQMVEAHELGIFEAGISKPGEMQKLEAVIQPTIGIFTMLGDAHNEGFLDAEHKLRQKFLLFQHCELLICCTNDLRVKEMAAGFNGRLLDWSNHSSSWMQVTSIQHQHNHSLVTCVCMAAHFNFMVPFTDDASIENTMHCIAMCLHLGMSETAINQRLALLRHLDMRLQWKRAIHQCHLLNDSYSNDFTSLVQAIEYLQQQSRHSKTTVILSDLSTEGDDLNLLYQQLASLLAQKNITRLICVGPHMKLYAHGFADAGLEVIHFAGTKELTEAFSSIAFHDEDILVKGGRQYEFEKIAALLEAQQHQTVLEINLSALSHNLNYYRSLIAPQTKLMVMVKAFGYGSGDAEIARTLQFNKVDYLAVAYVDEGIALRNAGVHLPVMVLNTEPAAFEAVEQYNLEPEVYSFEFLKTLLQWCRSKGITNMPVHVKVDTGMHRLGFSMEEMDELSEMLVQQRELIVKSVFTHLVASEDAEEDAFTLHQAQDFSKACNNLEEKIGYSFLRHAANTAAISRHPAAHFDMVRLGVGLYGGSANTQPVMQLMTTVAQIKKVKGGETVGYGRSGKLLRDSVIATVRIGYADGFRRALSNGVGAMWVKGKLAPVLGKVCMDMTMLDITDIPNVQEGDAVEVFGKNISIGTVAKQCGTITYEMMTGISQRVKRVYFEG